MGNAKGSSEQGQPAETQSSGSSEQGQPAETQSSDVIGKGSNQGSRSVSTYTTQPRIPATSQQQPWVPDAAMGARLLCGVTLCLPGAGESGHSVDVPEMPLPP